MSATVKPSLPGYRFTSADVAQARIPADKLGRMLLQLQPGAEPDISQLLAAILKSQVKSNSKYRPVPFNYSEFQKQLVLVENPLRNYLMIQNVGANDLMVVFEDGPQNVQDLSATADSQQLLVNLQTSALRIVAGGYFEPMVPPTNPITLFTLNDGGGGTVGTSGVAIEGS